MTKPMGLLQAARAFSNGKLTHKDYVASCVKRADDVEPWLKAFTFRVPEGSLSVADEGPLAGIPVAVKDVMETAGIPTTYGSRAYPDYVPETDAAVVARIKDLGGTVFGKTVTTEFAWRCPGPTVNPWNTAHTPGGSSSGSAAAVATGIVPLALGTQTVGSVVRPAAYCGVVGFKPSFGAIPIAGVHPLAQSLDHVGFFTRSVDDAGYALSVLADVGLDGSSPDLLSGTESLPSPRLALVVTPFAHKMSDEQTAALEKATADLRAAGAVVEPLALPEAYWQSVEGTETILAAEAAAIHKDLVARLPDKTSPHLKDLAAEGAQVSALAYIAALRLQAQLRAGLAAELHGFDAVLTVPATGEAPEGLAYTGDATFCSPWTFMGVPAITLPVAQSRNGLPLGIQLVAPFHRDRHLLRVAKWAEQNLKNPFAF